MISEVQIKPQEILIESDLSHWHCGECYPAYYKGMTVITFCGSESIDEGGVYWEVDCVVCMDVRRNRILPCGHYVY